MESRSVLKKRPKEEIKPVLFVVLMLLLCCLPVNDLDTSERIPAGGAVLDMMSSWVSHLPPEVLCVVLCTVVELMGYVQSYE